MQSEDHKIQAEHWLQKAEAEAAKLENKIGAEFTRLSFTAELYTEIAQVHATLYVGK